MEDGASWSGTPGQLQLLILFVSASFPIAGPNSVCVCERERLKRKHVLLSFTQRNFPGGWEVVWEEGHWTGVTLGMTVPSLIV